MGVVGIKNGTKSWGDAKTQEFIQPELSPKNVTKKDLEKLGVDNMGEMLNRLSDPNHVSESKKIRAVGSDKMDKDAFMKLMLAQMKNQDPTNPLKSHEMAAQLAQFSSLEQLQNVNTNLDEMKNAQKPTETYQSLNFIGKGVAGDSSKLTRLKGDKSHDFGFKISEGAQSAKIQIRDANGEVVRKIEMRDLKAGDNLYTWNGLDENGRSVPAGEYRMSIEALTSEGKKLAVKTDFEGVITGVNYTADGPVLLIGNQSVKLKDVKKIVDPGLLAASQQKDQNSKNATFSPLQNVGAVKQNKNEDVEGAADPIEVPEGNVMNSVPMSKELMSQIENEVKAK